VQNCCLEKDRVFIQLRGLGYLRNVPFAFASRLLGRPPGSGDQNRRLYPRYFRDWNLLNPLIVDLYYIVRESPILQNSDIRSTTYRQNITSIDGLRLPHKEGQLTILSKFLR
jgi:hypothetical protein